MDDAPFVPVGRVVKVHGVKGEVSVAFDPDLPFALSEGALVWAVPPEASPTPRRVEAIRPGPKGPLVKLVGVDDRGAADLLHGRTLVMRREDLPEEMFDDIPPSVTGYAVHDTERGLLGRIEETIVTGANDVWVIQGGPFGQVLVPVIDDVVLRIDEDAGHIDVRLLPGLIPDEEDAT